MSDFFNAYREGKRAGLQEIRELKASISLYREERHRLREALKPFGAAAEAWTEYPDAEPLVEGWRDSPEGACDLTVGHLRAAAAALTPSEDSPNA